MSASLAIAPTSNQTSRFRAPWSLFWVGFTVRIALLAIGKIYVLRTLMDHLAFGSEAGHIARAIIQGRGYADPFAWGHSGPTAWLAPGFPLFLACVFKLFGVYSRGSAFVVLATQCFFNAIMALWIWEIGARCFSRRVASIAAWIWALSPWTMMVSLMLIWETSISTAIFTGIFLLSLRMRAIGGSGGFTWARWFAWGIGWSTLAVLNPSLCLFCPVAGIWLMCGDVWPLARKLAGAAIAAAIVLATLAPWCIRNEIVFHKFIPARGNLGAELCLGNCHGIGGVIGQWDNPNQLLGSQNEYLQLGEAAFNEKCLREFKQVLRQRPKEFLKMSLLRLDFYWFGVQQTFGAPLGAALSRALYAFLGLGGVFGVLVAWRRKRPGADLFALALLVVPAMYYIVETQERYRIPLEPLLYLLTIYLVAAAEKNWRMGWSSKPAPTLSVEANAEPAATVPKAA